MFCPSVMLIIKVFSITFNYNPTFRLYYFNKTTIPFGQVSSLWLNIIRLKWHFPSLLNVIFLMSKFNLILIQWPRHSKYGERVGIQKRLLWEFGVQRYRCPPTLHGLLVGLDNAPQHGARLSGCQGRAAAAGLNQRALIAATAGSPMLPWSSHWLLEAATTPHPHNAALIMKN